MLPLLISDAKDKHPTFILFYLNFFPRFFFFTVFFSFFSPPKIGGAAFTALRPYRRRIRYLVFDGDFNYDNGFSLKITTKMIIKYQNPHWERN